MLTIGTILISRSLKNLKSLQILNLSNCGVTTKAAHELTDALLTLHELRELDVSLNDNIGLNEMSELLVAAFHNTNIHTLKITSCNFDLNIDLNSVQVKRIKKAIITDINCLELSRNCFNVNELLENITTLRTLCISKCSVLENSDDVMINRLFERISQNQSLTKLDISHNTLTVVASLRLAKALQSIKTLQSLYMNNCDITDDVAKDIAIAINYNSFLKELKISRNKLTGIGTNRIISSLKKNKYLLILEVASCNIFTGDSYDTLTEPMFHLQELDISFNIITINTTSGATIFSYLCSCSSLRVLKIADCNITDNDVDILVPVLSKNYALTHLDICGNKFSIAGYSKVFTSLSMLTCIKILKLSDCSMENKLSSKFASALKNNRELIHLELRHGYFSYTGIDVFSRSLENSCILQVLILVDCNITVNSTHKVAAILDNNRTIIHLDLSHNPLEEGVVSIINSLMGNMIIEILTLNNCRIPDTVRTDLASLARRTALVEFDICENRLTSFGALLVAKGFVDSTSLKILKIQKWIDLVEYLEDACDLIEQLLGRKGILILFK